MSERPEAKTIIAMRVMHLDDRGLTALQKVQEIIDDLAVHGYKIVDTAEIERMRTALKEIATMKPSHIVDGFVHGPALLLSNCQRKASAALGQRSP